MYMAHASTHGAHKPGPMYQHQARPINCKYGRYIGQIYWYWLVIVCTSSKLKEEKLKQCCIPKTSLLSALEVSVVGGWLCKVNLEF